MAHHPQDTPVPVPFVSRLTQHLQPGQTLFVHGRVNDGANGFQVNLLSGSPVIDEHTGSVVFHLNVRFGEGKVVMNNMTGGTWGKEERESNPFKPGTEFDLRIRALEDKFEVLANQKEIHEFKYRADLNTIDHLNIDGDISLSGVHWGGRFFQLPFETGFPAGFLRAGDRILMYGTPKGKRFELNFLGANGDILFHLNPRFDQNAVVRNASIGGAWGQEEREGAFPFKKEIAFDLIVVNEPYSIQIFVNGQRFNTFQHRTANPNGDYVGLRVDGEFELTGLEFSHTQQH